METSPRTLLVTFRFCILRFLHTECVDIMHEESDKECALYENMFVQVFKFRPQHGSNS